MPTPQEEAFKKAADIAGSPAALAHAIKIRPWALSRYDKNFIPVPRCLAIENFTNKQVRAEDLRPDINWVYVRANLKKFARFS